MTWQQFHARITAIGFQWICSGLILIALTSIPSDQKAVALYDYFAPAPLTKPLPHDSHQFLGAFPNTPTAQNVELVGQIGGQAYVVNVEGAYAYSVIGPNLLVIDVSDPNQLHLVSQLALNFQPFDMTIAGNHIYLVGYDSGLHIVDISNPNQPTMVGSIVFTGWLTGVAVAGDYAYVVDGNWDTGGLRIIDVSDSAHPVEAGFYTSAGIALRIVISNQHAYLLDKFSGLHILDISNPISPTLEGFQGISGQGLDIALAGNYAYVASYEGGLRIIDISNTLAPVEVGYYDSSDFLQSVAVAGNYAYLGGSNFMHVIEIADPTAPTELAVKSFAEVVDILVKGNYAYLMLYSRGLELENVLEPASPLSMGTYYGPGDAIDVAVANDVAYVASNYRGWLNVLDVGDVSHLFELSAFTMTNPIAVAFLGNYIHVANYYGVSVIDVTNQLDPTYVAFYGDNGTTDIQIYGQYAFREWEHGYGIYDVSDPHLILWVADINVPGLVASLTVADTYAYWTLAMN